MIQPRRWVDEDATQEERRLLLSAREDGPSRGSREKMFVALGIGGAAALGTAAATATATQLSTAAPALASTGAAAALSKAIPTGASVSALAIMKWVGVGAIAGLVTTGSANLIGRAADAREAAAAARANKAPDERNSRTSAVYAPAAPAAPETPAEPAAIELPEPAPPPPPAEVAPAPVPQKALPKLAANAPAPNVGKEVSTLDRAREALAAGDAPSALEALGQHESEFASGALGPEAELLRIQALLARREYNSAAVMARGFLMKNPKSPHVGRVRALLAQAKSAEAPTQSSE